MAEQTRQTEWEGKGFLRDLFLGKLQLDLIHPFPRVREERPAFQKFAAELERFLVDHERHPDAERAVELADLFCRNARRKVRRLFVDLWKNDDDRKNRLAASVMKGDHDLLTEGMVDLGRAPEAFQPSSLLTSRRLAGGDVQER